MARFEHVPRLPAVSLLLVAAGIAAASAPAMRTERLDRLGVVLEVPDGWARIDPLDLDAYSTALLETTGGAVAESYQFGFAVPTPSGFGYPAVLIQVKDTGRVPYGPLERLPPLETLRRAAGENVTGGMLGLAPPPYLREASFDRGRFCLRLTSTVPTLAGEPVVATTGSYLTERGLLSVHAFDRLSGFESSRPVLDRVIDSVVLPPGLSYRPRLTDRWPLLERVAGRRGLAAALVAVIGGCVTYAVLRRARRRRDGGAVVGDRRRRDGR